MALRVEGGRRYEAMNAAARGISEMALGWLRTVRRAGRGGEKEDENRGSNGTTRWEREGENSPVRRVSPELRIAPRGVALFMTAIDHRPASAGRSRTPH